MKLEVILVYKVGYIQEWSTVRTLSAYEKTRREQDECLVTSVSLTQNYSWNVF